MSEPIYVLSIERKVPNPAYHPARGPYDRSPEEPMYTEHTVTTATLNAEQWSKVQAAIVEALK